MFPSFYPAFRILSFFFPFLSFIFVSFLLCLYTLHLFYFLVFPYAVFPSFPFLYSPPFRPFFFSLQLLFFSFMSFCSPYLSSPFVLSSPLLSSSSSCRDPTLLAELSRTNTRGLNLSFYSSVILTASCVCVCLRSLSGSHWKRSGKIERVHVCVCTCPAVAGALLPAPRQRGHSPKWIHQALSLPLCAVASRSCLHQHMQIPSALMSLHVYIRHDEWINCGNSRSKLCVCVYLIPK